MKNQNNNNLTPKNFVSGSVGDVTHNQAGMQAMPKILYSVEQAKEAVEHIDKVVAGNILRGITRGEIKDPEVLNLKPQLQIVNFSGISDQEAALIMQSRIFDFFRLEIPFEDSMEGRYIIQGHYEKNNQRKILKKAILENSEKLGSLGMGQWIKLFDQEYKIEEREEKDIINFILNNSSAQQLTDSQKTILKKILHAYDTLLADQLVDIYDLIEAKERLRKTGGRVKQVNERDRLREFYRNDEQIDVAEGRGYLNSQAPMHEVASIKMIITQAMEKYPRINDQLISNNLIKVGSLSNMVKGSVRNWIKDYYSVVGAGNKDVMKRSSYVYHSQNAKLLNDVEKGRLLALLKSLEENFPIFVDSAKEEIIFDPKKVKVNNDKSNVRKPKIIFGDEAENNSHDNLSSNESNNVAKINHIQGNRFNLRSDHFEDFKEDKKIGITEKLLGKKQGELSSVVTNDDENIKFSSPQQLSVEKENNLKSDYRNIKPIN